MSPTARDPRIDKALEIAEQYGGFDGGHHKMWAIDQMVRALTGCPMVAEEAVDVRGKTYTYLAQGASDEYDRWVASCEDGEEGPNTYEWDCGTPP